MSNRLFQGVIHQMRDAIDRTIGVIDETSVIIACSELGRIGEVNESITPDVLNAPSTFVINGYTYKSFGSRPRPEYAVFVAGNDEAAQKYVQLLAISLSSIKQYYDEKYDRNNFIKNVILDNILPGGIYVKAREMHFNSDVSRVVLLVRIVSSNDISAFDVIQNLFPNKQKDFVFNISESDIVLVKEIKAGIDSFKIEGRNKTAYYTACVTGAYRAAVNAYLADPEHYVMPQFCLDEVNKVSHREYYTGFYFGPSANGQHYGDSQYIRDYEVVGMPVDCREDGTAVFALKNRFFKGEELELLQPGHAPYSFHAEAVNDDGEALDLFNVPQMKVHFQFPFAVDRYAILRKKKERPE